MSKPIRGQGGHLVFLICLKNTNLVEDVEILLPVKFRWIPFREYRKEVENVSANHRPGLPSCFSDRPKKTQTWQRMLRSFFLSSFVEFRSAVHRRSRKCFSQSEARAAILFFRSARKTQTWQRMLRSSFLSNFVEFRSSISEEKSKMSQPIRGQGGHFVFSDRPDKHKLGRGRWALASCQVSLNSVQQFQEVENMKS